jgi:heterodisulfide reductase subunit A-like polyferredoxin
MEEIIQSQKMYKMKRKSGAAIVASGHRNFDSSELKSAVSAAIATIAQRFSKRFAFCRFLHDSDSRKNTIIVAHKSL